MKISKHLYVLGISLLGGIGGSIPFVFVAFYLNIVIGPLYLLAGFASYTFYLYFSDFSAKTKIYPLFMQLGNFLAIGISQLVFFAFDPSFTSQASGQWQEKASMILSNSIPQILMAISLYFIISLIGSLITYIIYRILKIYPRNK